MRFTYDVEADAAYLYLIDEISRGQVRRSAWVPVRLEDAALTVDFDEHGQALGVEILGASRIFTPAMLDAIATSPKTPSRKDLE